MTTEPCPYCGSEPEWNERHDAFFCPVCNVWLEPRCFNASCHFCAGRPEKPSQADAVRWDWNEA